MSHRLRTGLLADRPALLDMLREHHAEEWADIPLAEEKIDFLVLDALRNGIVILGQTEEGEIAGSIGLAPSEYSFSREIILIDHWTYVRAGHRRSRLFVEMLGRAKAFSDRSGVPLVMALTSRSGTNRKARAYSRYLKPAGQWFTHGL